MVQFSPKQQRSRVPKDTHVLPPVPPTEADNKIKLVGPKETHLLPPVPPTEPDNKNKLAGPKETHVLPPPPTLTFGKTMTIKKIKKPNPFLPITQPSKIETLFLINEFLIITLEPIEQLSPITTLLSIIEL